MAQQLAQLVQHALDAIGIAMDESLQQVQRVAQEVQVDRLAQPGRVAGSGLPGRRGFGEPIPRARVVGTADFLRVPGRMFVRYHLIPGGCRLVAGLDEEADRQVHRRGPIHPRFGPPHRASDRARRPPRAIHTAGAPVRHAPGTVRRTANLSGRRAGTNRSARSSDKLAAASDAFPRRRLERTASEPDRDEPSRCAGAQLVVAGLLLAPDTVGGEPVYSGRRHETAVKVPRLEEHIDVDGVLDEPAWARATRLVDFSQYAPVDGRPAAQDTEVLVWYSPTAIHFGIRARAEGGTVRATLADRDRIDNDDQVHIFLSTFNDGRQAVVFGVNPLGVQLDGALAEGTRTQGKEFSGLASGREETDLSPDYIFDSRGRITDDGFEVEIRVPFKSLRFPSADPQTWGINVIRRSQETGHEDSWVAARRDSASFLAQSGTLDGLTDLRRGLVLDVNPVVTARADGTEAGDRWRYDTDTPEPGLNVRWGVTSNLTLNGTINPDFSQVEADAGEFVFDPRSAVYFPEKRPFFLDASELFATPNDLIYTRRIVAPVAAAKLTGKLAGLNVASLVAVDDPAQSLSGNDHPIFAIGRVQRDLGTTSKLGFIYTQRSEDARDNQVAGTDARFVFRELYDLQLQAAVSRTRVGSLSAAAPLWQATFARNGRRYSFRYLLRAVDDEFRTSSGFISRTGIVRGLLTNQLAVYGAPGSWWERASGDVALDGTWQYDDFVGGRGPQDRKLHFNFNATLRGGWQTTASVLVETFGYDEALYRDYAVLLSSPDGDRIVPFTGTPELGNLDYVLSLTTPPRGGLSVYAFVLWGRDENFYEWAPADIKFVELTAQWRPQAQLRVDAGWKLQSYNRRTDGSLVGQRTIPRFKVEYQLTRAIFLRGVAEYDAEMQDDLRDDSRTGAPLVIRDPLTGLYERALGFDRARLRTDLLFSYQPVPGTVFFAGYTNILLDPRPDGQARLGRAVDGFFVKLSYLWRL